MITIGIDPHKHTHTAVAIDIDRQPIGLIEIPSDPRMLASLRRWASSWPGRM